MQKAAAMRKNMILGQLYTNEITDRRILAAMADIAREPFLPEGLRGAAYVDEDMEVLPGRYLMAPLTFARLLTMAEITPDCRVLNIGCLTGYSAAVLAKLAAHVVAIDSNAAAIEQSHEHMKRLNITNVNIQHVRNMADGYALSAPYNAIVITGAIHSVSEPLGSQLSADSGRLVTIRNTATRPDSKSGPGKGVLVQRLDHHLQYREHFDASCPLLPGFEQGSAFVF
jgi:protein-L-isoaspartate(D-aspartate) O-methyltransferase